MINRLLDLAIAIQQIPAPTFREAQRAEFVREQFAAEGLPVEVDSSGNVLARLAGQGRGRPLIISAHLDTVFPLNSDLPVERAGNRILAPGIGDNALGVAALLGLVWMLREKQMDLPGDLWLAATVCEEGLGNLRGIRAVVDRFGSNALAYLSLEGMSLGQIYHRGLGVQRYRISAHTAGGHSWKDYGQPSAIHELTALATRITALRPPSSPRTTLNIGTIAGGSSVNVIAADAAFELDLRSESSAALDDISQQVKQIARSAEKPGVQIVTEKIGERPSGSLPPTHPLVRLAQQCLREVNIEPHLNIGSTDANLPLSRGLPAVTIGLTTGEGAHTVHEFIDTAPVEKGMEQLRLLVSRVWEINLS